MSILSWDIGALVEYVLAFLALLVVLIITLVSVHRRKDALRTPFLWLKIAVIVFFLFLVVRGVAAILTVVELSVPRFDVLDVLHHLSNVNGLLRSVADIFILLCLVELALSCLRALGKDGIYHSIFRYSNFVLLLTLFALAVAAFGTGETWAIQDDYYNYTTTLKLFSAFSIIYWIAALFVLSLSGCVLFISIRRKYLQNIASLFFVASLFNLARSTYNFAYSVLYYINYSIYTRTPQYLIILGPILYAWFTVILLGILMGMGYKKLNGLWSQQPPLQQGYMVDNRGGNAFYGGRELPVGSSPTYYPQQHRHPSELIGSAAPAFRAELGGYSSPQQYYEVQNQQQPPYVQNQMQYAGSVPAPAHSPTPQYNVAPTNAAPNIPGNDNVMRPSPHEQQPQVKQPSEVGVAPDQKA